MQSIRYLNMVLTVITVLLVLNLWTAWTSSPTQNAAGLFEANAVAASKVPAPPNPAKLRIENVAQLKALNKKMDTLIDLFKSGKARVTVGDPSKKN